MRATALLLVLAPFAYSQSPDAYIDGIEKSIKQGLIPVVVPRLRVDVIAGNADYAFRICRAAADARGMVPNHRDKYPAAIKTIAEIGTKAKDAHFGEAKGVHAYADSLLFGLRITRSLRQETAAADWLKVVELLCEAHALEADGGKPLERAVTILREGQKANGVDADKLKAREKELCKEGAKTYPETAIFQPSSDDELKGIEGLIETDRKEGKKRLQAFLDKMKEKLKAKPDSM